LRRIDKPSLRAQTKRIAVTTGNRPAMIAAQRHREDPAPEAPPALDRAVFVRPIAHRGLHDRAKGRVENTAPAFQAAIDRGYGIECDLQAAADDVPMVFHDTKLERLMDAAGPIRSYTAKELGRFRYAASDQRMLRFSDFLQLVNGRVPLLIEVKGDRQSFRGDFLANVARLARRYKGPIALMSFERGLVMALGELATRVPRGSVVGSKQFLAGLWRKAERGDKGRGASRVFGTTPVDVSFLAVDVKLAAVARKWLVRQSLQIPLFTWTVRTPRQRATAARWADAPIFEGYEA
jgi:glycerophosphoryl diester phosphodiesterase